MSNKKLLQNVNSEMKCEHKFHIKAIDVWMSARKFACWNVAFYSMFTEDWKTDACAWTKHECCCFVMTGI